MLQRLKDLADEFVVRDGRKLFQLARSQGVQGATTALAAQALRSDVGRQVLAPPPRATGKSAAPRPNSTIQADLIDFSLNLPPTSEGNRYLAVAQDVFTRELRAVPLDSKDPQSVAVATKLMVDNLREGETDNQFTISTDFGAEYSQLNLPGAAAHRVKDPSDRQGLAVIDTGIKTLKKDLATIAARKGGEFDKNIGKVVSAYNARPHSTTIVPPEDVQLVPEAEFEQYQQNADKFAANRGKSERRMTEVKEMRTIRAPLPTQGRSFRPQYGDARRITAVDSGYVTMAGGRQVLLKQAQAVPADGARRPAGSLYDPAFIKQQRLGKEADAMEEFLLRQPNYQVKVADLDRTLRTALPVVKRGLQRARTSLRVFLRMFPERFKVERGLVSAVNLPAAPEPPAPPAPVPRAETREERNTRLDALSEASRAREEASREARLARERERLAGLRGVFGERPR